MLSSRNLLFALLFGLCWFSACQPGADKSEAFYIGIQGETMGTTYAITFGPNDRGEGYPAQLKDRIDSLLLAFDACLSTYNPNSVISAFNEGDFASIAESPCADWFTSVLQESALTHEASGAMFDPTVLPLLSYWGFFKTDPFEGAIPFDEKTIDSLLNFVGFADQIRWNSAGGGLELSKVNAETALDFNAIAKGKGVDLVAELLDQEGLENYLVEIGGEVRTAGKNVDKKNWGVAIEKPVEQEREALSLVRLSGESMASSGNYRRFWEKDGKKYGHSLNPKTGRPEMSNLLAVSVISRKNCMHADAWATALMVMGLDKGLLTAEQDDQMEAYFIYLDSKGEMQIVETSGFGKFLTLSRKAN